MKPLLIACLLAFLVAGKMMAEDLVIHVEEKNKAIVATCGTSTYVLKTGEANQKFLLDKVIDAEGKPRKRGVFTVIFSANVSFASYFHTMSHLNKVGYEKMQVYIQSEDGKSMMPFEIKSSGDRVESR